MDQALIRTFTRSIKEISSGLQEEEKRCMLANDEFQHEILVIELRTLVIFFSQEKKIGADLL